MPVKPAQLIDLVAFRQDSQWSTETKQLLYMLDGYRISSEEDNYLSSDELKLLDINQNGIFEIKEDLAEALLRLTGAISVDVSHVWYQEIREVLSKHPALSCRAFPKDTFCASAKALSSMSLRALLEGPFTELLRYQVCDSESGVLVFSEAQRNNFLKAIAPYPKPLQHQFERLLTGLESRGNVGVEDAIAALNDRFFVPHHLYFTLDGTGLRYLVVGKVEAREKINNPYKTGHSVELLYLSDLNTRFEKVTKTSFAPLGLYDGMTLSSPAIYNRKTTGSQGPKVNMDRVREEAKEIQSWITSSSQSPLINLFKQSNPQASYRTALVAIKQCVRAHELQHAYDISRGISTSEERAFLAELAEEGWQYTFLSCIQLWFVWTGSSFQLKEDANAHGIAFSKVLARLALAFGHSNESTLPILEIYQSLKTLPNRKDYLRNVLNTYF